MKFRHGIPVGLSVGFCSLSLASILCAQGTVVPREPSALTLAEKAEAALVGGQPLNDGILQGQYVQHVFPPPPDVVFTGPITLQFQGDSFSRVHLSVPSGTFGVQPGVELCTVNSHGEVVGAWMAESSPPSATTYLPAHGTFANCWSAPDWFLPAMVMSRAKDSHTAVLYRGRASEDGHDDEVLRFYRVPDEGDSGFWRNLTLVEVHLDRQTLLPDSITFWRGASGNARALPLPPADPLSQSNFPIKVRYSDYRKIEGFVVPFTIDWSQTGGMTLSVKIESVQMNTGFSVAAFALPEKLESEATPQEKAHNP